MVVALDCGSRGHGFEPHYLPKILQKSFNTKESIFFYEGHVWKYSIDRIFSIDTLFFNKNWNILGLKYGFIFNKILNIYRKSTLLENNIFYIYYWYYLYYISCLFNKNLLDYEIENSYEGINILVFNLKNKQMRMSILTHKNKIYNLSTGRVLKTLNIVDKSKKKTNKGERLFIEFLSNFLLNKSIKFGLSKLAYIKIINIKKKTYLNETLIKLLNSKFSILKIIFDFKISNNYTKLSGIRSIKRRLKKRLIRNENLFNL